MVACLKQRVSHWRRYTKFKNKVNLMASIASDKMRSRSRAETEDIQNQYDQLQDLVSNMDDQKSRTEDLLQEASENNLMMSQKLEDSEMKQHELVEEMAMMRKALAEKDEISRQLLEQVKQNMSHRRRVPLVDRND